MDHSISPPAKKSSKEILSPFKAHTLKRQTAGIVPVEQELFKRISESTFSRSPYVFKDCQMD
jgi:hypothetical protein